MIPVAIHPSPATDGIPRIPHQFRTSGSFPEITGYMLQGGGYKGVPKIRFNSRSRSREYRYRHIEEFDFSFWLEEKESLLNFKEVQSQTSLEEKSRLLRALKQEVSELANSSDALRALEGHPDNQEVMRYKNLLHELSVQVVV